MNIDSNWTQATQEPTIDHDQWKSSETQIMNNKHIWEKMIKISIVKYMKAIETFSDKDAS